MQSKNLVVAHYRSGRIVRGTTADFALGKPQFHVVEQGKEIGTPVKCADLKAVFFVRSLTGDPTREDVRGFVAAPGETKHGRKVAVQFTDTEFVCGYSEQYSPGRDRFFLFPADAGSNNQRVLVFTAAVTKVAIGPAAEELALATLGARR